MAQTWAYVNSGEYGSDSSPASPTLSAFAATTGNAILLGVSTIRASAYETPSSITDTAGNTYTLRGSFDYFLLSTYRCRAHIYEAENITGNASNVITVNLSVSGIGVRAIALHISGLATSGMYDSSFTPAGNLDTSSPMVTTSGNTTDNDELVFGVFSSFDSVTFSSNSPSVLQEQVSEGNGPMGAATYHAASSGSNNVSVACGSSTYGTICLSRAFKQASSTTYYQSTSGNIPTPSGVLSDSVSYGQSVSGDMPEAQGALIKKIFKIVTGSAPAQSGSILKLTSKNISGNAPQPTGDVLKKTGKGLSGSMPSSSGSVDGVLTNLAKAIFGNFPAPVGAIIKKIGKSISGSMPSQSGDITKKIGKVVQGSTPSPTGNSQTSWNTDQATSGDLPAPSGTLSTLLNPVVLARSLFKIIGSGFKKLIG